MYELLMQIHSIYVEDMEGGELLIKSKIYEILYYLFHNMKKDGEGNDT